MRLLLQGEVERDRLNQILLLLWREIERIQQRLEALERWHTGDRLSGRGAP